MRELARRIDAWQDRFGRGVSWLSLAMVVVVFGDVLSRYLFRVTSTATQELEWYLFGTLYLLAAGYTLLHDEHVRVDILYSQLSPLPQGMAAISCCCGVFFFPSCLLVIYTAWPFVRDSWASWEGSSDPGGIPARWALKSMIILGFLRPAPPGRSPRRQDLLVGRRAGRRRPEARPRGYLGGRRVAPRPGAGRAHVPRHDRVPLLRIPGRLQLDLHRALLRRHRGRGWGFLRPDYFNILPLRIWGTMSELHPPGRAPVLFMGVALERVRGWPRNSWKPWPWSSGRLPGGMAISVVVVGAILAASTGIVGASVITMGLISLPTMLRRGYSKELTCGTICASGTLGQIIPPSVILILLGDIMGVSVGDLYIGAVVPGLVLVVLYILYLAILAWWKPHLAPAVASHDLRSLSRGRRSGGSRSRSCPR